jgi:ABC-2 type transport system ATP-binding protein
VNAGRHRATAGSQRDERGADSRLGVAPIRIAEAEDRRERARLLFDEQRSVTRDDIPRALRAHRSGEARRALRRRLARRGDRLATVVREHHDERGDFTALPDLRRGAGKTSALRMLLGLLAPTRGTATLLGHDSQRLPPELRARVGYLAEGHPAYPWMRAAELEQFQAQYYPKWKHATFAAVLASFRIDERAKVGQLSRGQRAGLCLGLTLATDPELLVLDDPTLGLDPVARRSFLEAVVYFTRRADRTIVLSSHLLSDVERVADYLAVLDGGTLRACCSVEAFRKQVRQYVMHFEGEPPQLPSFPGLLSTSRLPREVRMTVVSTSDALPEPLRAFASATLEEVPMSLEDSVIAYLGDRGERSFLIGDEA